MFLLWPYQLYDSISLQRDVEVTVTDQSTFTFTANTSVLDASYVLGAGHFIVQHCCFHLRTWFECVFTTEYNTPPKVCSECTFQTDICEEQNKGKYWTENHSLTVFVQHSFSLFSAVSLFLCQSTDSCEKLESNSSYVYTHFAKKKQILFLQVFKRHVLGFLIKNVH